MQLTVILIGIILLAIALGIIHRVFTLIDIVKSKDTENIGVSNNINALLFLVFTFVGFGSAFWYSVGASKYLLPVAASEHGVETDSLFWITMTVILVAFVLTNVVLFMFAYLYRYKKTRKAYFYPDNDKLEMIWTIVPAIVLTVLVFMGWKSWSKIFQEPEDAQKIEIVGRQFNWHVRYSGQDGKLGKYNYKKIDDANSVGVDFSDKNAFDDIMPNKMYLAKGRPVNLKIRARDVLHSVFLPHFRVKMDAVPGTVNDFYFTPTITTDSMRSILKEEVAFQELNADGEPKWSVFNYEMACTEICGRDHNSMRFEVVVVEPEEFDAWYKEQETLGTQMADYIKEKYNTEVPTPQKEEKEEVQVDLSELEEVQLEDEADAKILEMAFSSLEFETGSATIKSTSFGSLDSLAILLTKYEDLKLSVAGHTDNSGDPEANLSLSKNRAQAVEVYLGSKGILGDRVYTYGFGDTQPIEPNETEEGKAKNRRVNLSIVK